jgi:hypothetical protein
MVKIKNLNTNLNSYNFMDNKKSVSSFVLPVCDARIFSKNNYSTTIPVLMDPITASMTLFKSKAATGAAASCPTPTALYPDINLWNYMGSVVKGTLTDLTAPLLWKCIFITCGIFLVGYGTVSIYHHATEIYQIVQFYKQIVGSPELVQLLDHKFEFLNHFNKDAAVRISKLTFNLLNPNACQIIVKFCLHNSEYMFHGVLMDISNSNMI